MACKSLEDDRMTKLLTRRNSRRLSHVPCDIYSERQVQSHTRFAIQHQHSTLNMDSGTLTNISIVYPDIQQEETGFISLQPLVFTVCFSGMLSEGLLQENIVSCCFVQNEHIFTLICCSPFKYQYLSTRSTGYLPLQL